LVKAPVTRSEGGGFQNRLSLLDEAPVTQRGIPVGTSQSRLVTARVSQNAGGGFSWNLSVGWSARLSFRVKGRPSGDWRSGLAEALFIEGAGFLGLGNGLVRVPVTQSERCGSPTYGTAKMWKPIGCPACHSERETGFRVVWKAIGENDRQSEIGRRVSGD